MSRHCNNTISTRFWYDPAYHICHAQIFLRAPRHGGAPSFAWSAGGAAIEVCPQCGKELVREDVRLRTELLRHPGGIGQALKEWSRARRRAVKKDQQEGAV